MEVVEQLDFLITNTEVKELLSAVEREAKDTSYKRPPIACETSKHVSSSTLSVASRGPRAAPRAAQRSALVLSRRVPRGVSQENGAAGAQVSGRCALMQHNLGRGRHAHAAP